MKSCRLMSCYYFYAVVWVTMNARFWCRAASFCSSETCTLTCKQHLHGGFVALWLTLQRFVVHEKVNRVYLRGNNRLLLSTMWGPVCVVVPLSFVTRWRLNLATAVVCVCVCVMWWGISAGITCVGALRWCGIPSWNSRIWRIKATLSTKTPPLPTPSNPRKYLLHMRTIWEY